MSHYASSAFLHAHQQPLALLPASHHLVAVGEQMLLFPFMRLSLMFYAFVQRQLYIVVVVDHYRGRPSLELALLSLYLNHLIGDP